MKLFGKTRDGVTDRLLRAYVSRPADARQVCPDFDPDLANAYLERSLTTSSRSPFEAHLSECAACRKNVVALMRFAEADRTASVFAGRGEVQAARLSPAMRVFAVLSRPQWAMAAAGVIVLAISLPLLLSSNNSRLSKQVSQAVSTEEQSSDKSQAALQPDEANKVASLRQAEPDSSASGGASSKQREMREGEKLVANAGTSGDGPSALAKSRAAGSEQPQKLESKTELPAIDDLQSKTKSQGQVAAQAPAQAGTQLAGETQLAKKDADSGRQQQQERDSAQASDAKPPRADEDRAPKEKARTSEEVAALPAPASSPDASAGRRLKRPPAKLALRDSRTNEAVRPAEKSIRGKKFLFKDDAWTDKDFDPDKDLPVVTIIRDSNVYTEVLGKRAGLKPYLAGFAETERAIIVYKGTVYKLIPQQTDK